ncbi:Cell adhesion molecule 2 [Penaeus vannamei]|uniref:Cell adhesion molecule 2 n=1 Tax=Penaeus vannamei TaxID=6689 RepID=A0A423TGX5_PENVA|nr:Cell adhesion molecule 2 [Penaeus vannamei]
MVERGEDVTLTCEFDLAGEKLYSVKWYKAGREFYRFVPADWPTKQDFEQKGVIVDTDRSDSQKVALKGITVDSSGRYKCEVLTEAPQFKTLVRSGFLTVFELPEGRPEVMGGQPQYRPGDTVNLTCRAPKSIPPANLTWYINEKEVGGLQSVFHFFYG